MPIEGVTGLPVTVERDIEAGMRDGPCCARTSTDLIPPQNTRYCSREAPVTSVRKRPPLEMIMPPGGQHKGT